MLGAQEYLNSSAPLSPFLHITIPFQDYLSWNNKKQAVVLIYLLLFFPGGGNGNPFQYSCLANPMDREAWRATAHRVTESDTAEATEHTLLFFLNYFLSFLFILYCFYCLIQCYSMFYALCTWDLKHQEIEKFAKSWCSNTLATWCEEPIHWERPRCWERLKAKGKESGRGWDS